MGKLDARCKVNINVQLWWLCEWKQNTGGAAFI